MAIPFNQFLEEARQHASSKLDPQNPSTNPEQYPKRKPVEVQKNNKKSWKNSLISWWKLHKKSKPSTKPEDTSNHVSRPKKGHVSGPIYGIGVRAKDSIRQRRPVSGPVASLFDPNKKIENDDIPYMCLDKVNITNNDKSYGPVYLVT